MKRLSSPTTSVITKERRLGDDQLRGPRLAQLPRRCSAIALAAIVSAQFSCAPAPSACARVLLSANASHAAAPASGWLRAAATYELAATRLQEKLPKLFHPDSHLTQLYICNETGASRIHQFTNSIGVNVHVEYSDGEYAGVPNVISGLAYLGIDQVRDANLNPANRNQSSYASLAAVGIRFDLIVGASRPIVQSMASLDAFEAAHPGAVEAVEGPNEVNNWPITYNALTGAPAYAAFQSALDSAVKGDGRLAGVSVYGLTGSYLVVSGFDYASIHPYASKGAQPYAAIAANLAQYRANSGSVPFVITEAGYNTFSRPGDVDQLTQAKEMLNLLFDAQKTGAAKTFLYQLLDAYAPGTTNGRDQFGLFNYDNSPKPVATAIHNLTAILADPGATAASFQVGALNYTLSGMPAAASSLLFEKSSGAFDLVLWSEPQIWDAGASTEISVAPSQTVVALGGVYADVKVFDPLSGTTPIVELHNVSQVTLGLTDHPLIVETGPVQVGRSTGRTR